VDDNDHLVRNDLGGVIVDVPVGDCRLEFRRQRGTSELWCVTIGPLATLARPMLRADVMARVDRKAGQGSRARYAKWQRVRIDDELLIAFRARGSDLEFAYLFSDGAPQIMAAACRTFRSSVAVRLNVVHPKRRPRTPANHSALT